MISQEELDSLTGAAPPAAEAPGTDLGVEPGTATEPPAAAETPATDLGVEPGTATEPPPPPVAPGPRVRQYIPSTGPQITKFLAAVSGGMQDAHYASEQEVDAFYASR